MMITENIVNCSTLQFIFLVLGSGNSSRKKVGAPITLIVFLFF